MDSSAYTWQTVACTACDTPDARFVPGDSDRPDIFVCTRCPAHRDPSELATTLAPLQVLAVHNGALSIGTPRPPEELTAYTKGIVELADTKGLRPMWRTGKARHKLVLSSAGPHGPSGCVVVGARTGKVLRGQITHGAGGSTSSVQGTNEVRALLAALTRSACPPFCRASTVEACPSRH